MKLGTTELLIILAIVVVLFGPSQIPKLSKMFGKATKNFRDGMKEDDNSSDDSHKADTTES
ncbi:MAG: twin-arginine translocase TatA/TatE family subunit [Lachnospiraceae bacterium]|nr:twin-arginine translocase TatA/TatE family subunit [Lachnospiraceae bacterium]